MKNFFKIIISYDTAFKHRNIAARIFLLACKFRNFVTNNYSIFSVSIEHVLRIGHRRGDDECKGVPAQHPDPGGPTQAYQGTCVG